MNNYNQYSQPNYYQQHFPIQSNSIIWVQGMEGAKAYQIAPNSIVQLMDSENDGIFYIKTSDNIGMSNLRTFKYVEVDTINKPEASNVDLTDFVRKDELEALITSILNKEESSNEQSVSTVSKPKSLLNK